MRFALGLLGLASICAQTQALYFYLDGTLEKCFFEELPKDTMVVGTFKASEWSEEHRTYVQNHNMRIQVSVDEVFDNHHRVVNQRLPSEGKFTFSAADSGDHRLCIRPIGVPSAAGFLWGGSQVGNIKFEIDLVIGETSQIESSDKSKLGDMAQKIKDLTARLHDVRREQIFQREREAEFRDQSEAVNSRVVRWTLIQIVILSATCAWQLTYLRAFFIKQKLT